MSFESFRVNSLNNGRKYFGQTYCEDDGPFSQRIEISDAGKAIFRIDFTEEEFKSNDKFCRGISELIESMFLQRKFNLIQKQ